MKRNQWCFGRSSLVNRNLRANDSDFVYLWLSNTKCSNLLQLRTERRISDVVSIEGDISQINGAMPSTYYLRTSMDDLSDEEPEDAEEEGLVFYTDSIMYFLTTFSDNLELEFTLKRRYPDPKDSIRSLNRATVIIAFILTTKPGLYHILTDCLGYDREDGEILEFVIRIANADVDSEDPLLVFVNLMEAFGDIHISEYLANVFYPRDKDGMFTFNAKKTYDDRSEVVFQSFLGSKQYGLNLLRYTLIYRLSHSFKGHSMPESDLKLFAYAIVSASSGSEKIFDQGFPKTIDEDLSNLLLRVNDKKCLKSIESVFDGKMASKYGLFLNIKSIKPEHYNEIRKALEESLNDDSFEKIDRKNPESNFLCIAAMIYSNVVSSKERLWIKNNFRQIV